MSVRMRWNHHHPYQFLKLAHLKILHLRTDSKAVQEKNQERNTILNFRKILGTPICLWAQWEDICFEFAKTKSSKEYFKRRAIISKMLCVSKEILCFYYHRSFSQQNVCFHC